jgi:hypothetical protein
MGAFVGPTQGAVSCYRTRRGRGYYFAGAAVAGPASVTCVCFRRPRDKSAPLSLATSASALLGGISCFPRCSRIFALLGFYEVRSSLTYHDASG